MIARILEDGQYEIDEATQKTINDLDTELAAAMDAGDESQFASVLLKLLDTVRSEGTLVDPSRFVPSDLALPPAGATIADLRALLATERSDGE